MSVFFSKFVDMGKEIITCSAIWYKDLITPVHNVININKGLVLCGHRHPHIIGQCISLLGKKQFELGESEQGFLTNKNRFVRREEALIIALESNQVIDITDVRGDRLHSEDLY